MGKDRFSTVDLESTAFIPRGSPFIEELALSNSPMGLRFFSILQPSQSGDRLKNLRHRAFVSRRDGFSERLNRSASKQSSQMVLIPRLTRTWRRD
jgi:hypothetical protein